jgi:hypothetical protein
VEVEISEHSEGGSVYRPRLCFGKAEFVPVSMFWYQTKEQSEAVVKEIHGFLNLHHLKKNTGDCSPLIYRPPWQQLI